MLRQTFRIYRRFSHNSQYDQAMGESSTYVEASYKLYTKFYPADEKRLREERNYSSNDKIPYIYFIQEEFTNQEPMKDLY